MPLEIQHLWLAEAGSETFFKVISNGKSVAGVTVKAAGNTSVTNGEGSASLRFKETGGYRVVASEEGYASATSSIQVYPKGNEAIPIRGMRWPFPPFDAERLHSMRMAGANYIALKVWYSVDTGGRISPAIHWEGDAVRLVTQDEFESYAEHTIGEARAYGFKVLLVPFLWGSDPSLARGRDPRAFIKGNLGEFEKQLTSVVLDVARLAQKYRVEMLVPADNLVDIAGWEFASRFYQKILPELRQIYQGALVAGSHKYNEALAGGEFPDFDYSGYDFAGLAPDFDFDFSSWEQTKACLERLLDYADHLKEKYHVKVILSRVAFQPFEKDMKILSGGERQPADVKVKWYDMVLRETLNRVDGLFFYMWEYSIPQPLYQQRTGDGTKWIKAYQGKGAYNLIKQWYSQPPTAYLRQPKGGQIVIDGKSDDWVNIDPLCVDPPNDSWWPDRDLKALSATVDDDNLYLMVESYTSPDYPSLIYVYPNPEDASLFYLLSASPGARQVRLIHINELLSPPNQDLGMVGEAAFGEVVEVKIPLQLLSGKRERMVILVYARAEQHELPKKIPGFPYDIGELGVSVDACGDEEVILQQ